MPNRTEMLHFRATPEEKTRIKENAGHAEVALSAWMRDQSLKDEKPWGAYGRRCAEPDMQDSPTQPVVEAPDPPLANPGSTFICCGNPKDGDHEPWCDVGRYVKERGETYEQFMERRVPELLGQDVDTGDVESAQLQARAEWAALEP